MLRERTGGWAAGLRLMLESNSDAAVPPNLVEAPETLFEYLATEVYERSPPELRDLWLATAYLPRFTAAIASALAEREDTSEQLNSSQPALLPRTRTGTRPRFSTMRYSASLAQHERVEHCDRASPDDRAILDEMRHIARLRAQDFRAAIPLILREAPSLLANVAGRPCRRRLRPCRSTCSTKHRGFCTGSGHLKE